MSDPSKAQSFLFAQLIAILKSIAVVWGFVWWIVIPIIAAIIFWEFWMFYIHVQWSKKINWKTLEIQIPKNILKTPKAMEQIFAAAHAMHVSTHRFMKKYWEGEQDHAMSFELVGRAGESRFYVRLPEQFRNVMESAIYSQYPEAEIGEVDDYTLQMPKILPNKEFDLYGGEQILGNPNSYPVRTYPMFEEAVEEQRIDTMAFIMEAMSKLKDDEQIWLQFIIRPVGDSWKKEGEDIVNKMLGIEDEKKKKGGFFSGFSGLGFSLSELFSAPFVHPNQEVVRRDEKPTNFKLLLSNPSTKDIVDGIREKISKIAFETTLRFVYMDHRDSFKRDNVSSITGYFKQFNTQNLNYFRPDINTLPIGNGLFGKKKIAWRKRMLYERYCGMYFSAQKPPILNIEELATIYHFPISATGTTELEKISSRKGGPPSSLPLIGE
jgi:hypothetical protein